MVAHVGGMPERIAQTREREQRKTGPQKDADAQFHGAVLGVSAGRRVQAVNQIPAVRLTASAGVGLRRAEGGMAGFVIHGV